MRELVSESLPASPIITHFFLTMFMFSLASSGKPDISKSQWKSLVTNTQGTNRGRDKDTYMSPIVRLWDYR